MSFTIKSNFIGLFKVGDNINHNLQILSLLYKYYAEAAGADQKLLLKPITITIVSIIEALLYDLHYRIKSFTTEGVQNISIDVLNYIRGKHLDELEKYIASAKKHNLFQRRNEKFYDYLDELRKLRNRVHIQNRNNYFESDESNAFNDERRILAEKALEKVMRIMLEKYHRNDHHHHVADFTLPWNPHF